MRKTSLKYCWRPKLVYPYESLWSLLQKIALWNYCSISVILRHFGKSNFSFSGSSLQNLNVSIKIYLDKDKLIKGLQIPEKILCRSVAQHYLLPKEISFFVPPILRFCPKCITYGYHSIYHQLLFFEKCPIHHILLETKCPYCGSFIEPTFMANNFKNPYCCPKCKTSFLSDELGSIGLPFNFVEKLFEKIEKFLVTRIQYQPETMDFRLWRFPERIGFELSKKLSKVFSSWSIVYGKGSNDKRVAFSNKNPLLVFERKFLHDRKYQEFKYEVPLFKSFNRKLKQLLLKNHYYCFSIMKPSKIILLRNGFDVDSKICPLVLAYIYWRRYWENDDQVLYPGTRLSSKKPYRFLSIKSYSYSIENWAGSHVFIQELKATFIESICKALRNIDAKPLISQDPKLTFQYFPYWETYTDHLDKKCFLWFWRSINLMELLKQIPCPQQSSPPQTAVYKKEHLGEKS